MITRSQGISSETEDGRIIGNKFKVTEEWLKEKDEFILRHFLTDRGIYIDTMHDKDMLIKILMIVD